MRRIVKYLVAIVVFKEGGDFPYEGIRSWKTQGGFLILTRSRPGKGWRCE